MFQRSYTDSLNPVDYELRVVEVNTGEERTLATFDVGGMQPRPAWFPDGSRVAYHDGLYDALNLTVVDLFGEPISSAGPQWTGSADDERG